MAGVCALHLHAHTSSIASRGFESAPPSFPHTGTGTASTISKSIDNALTHSILDRRVRTRTQLAGGRAAEDDHDHEECPAEGVGCPLPDGHDHRILDEAEHEHDDYIDYHIELSTDRPRGVRAGKVVGFRVRTLCVGVASTGVAAACPPARPLSLPGLALICSSPSRFLSFACRCGSPTSTSGTGTTSTTTTSRRSSLG
jgi:hypothetical protein